MIAALLAAGAVLILSSIPRGVVDGVTLLGVAYWAIAALLSYLFPKPGSKTESKNDADIQR